MIPPIEPSGIHEALCEGLQADLSSMIDGELDDRAAVRAIGHLEACGGCRDFFDHVRAHVNLHHDLADSEGLLNRFALFTGDSASAHGQVDLEARLVVHRLATILYQLGKAYTLSVIDDAWRQRVFEPAVCIERERLLGRGFIDGVAAQPGRASEGDVDWSAKRHLLNGTLERLPRREDKARRLLEECLVVEDDHDPAQIYLALLDAHEGKVLRASRRLEEVFRSAVDPTNRGHAASQLGRLLFGEGDHRAALVWFRWIQMSGLADEEPRFAVVRFNVGLCYAHLGEQQRALAAFRRMLDRHPDRAGDLADIFRGSPELRATIDRQPGFTLALARTCPELFVAPQPARSGGDSHLDPHRDSSQGVQ